METFEIRSSIQPFCEPTFCKKNFSNQAAPGSQQPGSSTLASLWDPDLHRTQALAGDFFSSSKSKVITWTAGIVWIEEGYPEAEAQSPEAFKLQCILVPILFQPACPKGSLRQSHSITAPGGTSQGSPEICCSSSPHWEESSPHCLC